MRETLTTLLAQLSNTDHVEQSLAIPASFLHDSIQKHHQDKEVI